MTHTPTDEQAAIIARAKDKSSLLINALAGSAKTTTLAMMAPHLPMVPTFVGAFNKRVADDMAKRLPSHMTCSTMNSIGHRVWSTKLGKRLRVETDKTYSALKEIADARPLGERRAIQESFSSLLRAARLAKSAGYVPERMATVGRGLTSLDDLLETFYQQLDCEVDDEFISVLDLLLERSIAESFQGLIDFDDQVYMSCLFGGTFPKFPIVMVDEAQDLSPLNHEMLAALSGGRLIAVGDPQQAIYGFRGASHTSMAQLKERFDMEELTLSTSFRCPQAVVRNVHWWVPHMRFPTWAAAGAVSHLEEWSARDIPDGSAIICRNNAPIFSVALRLIQAGRGVKILGNDIGKNLVAVLKKLGPGDTKRELVLTLISAWEESQLKKAHRARQAAVRDKAECLRVFAEASRTLDEAIAYANTIFNASGPIQLMTGHKSKGGEWPIVFHLDAFLVPSKWAVREAEETGDESKLIQEKNLKYVIETRAQESLIYINSEGYR